MKPLAGLNAGTVKLTHGSMSTAVFTTLSSAKSGLNTWVYWNLSLRLHL